MDDKAIIKWIIDEIKHYKTYTSLLMELDWDRQTGEALGVSACTLSDMPCSQTNKFHSMTENMALNNNDYVIIKKSIIRIEGWLNRLDDDERFVISKRYIHNVSMLKILSMWEIEMTEKHWHTIRREGIWKILQYEKNEKTKYNSFRNGKTPY